MDQIPCAYRVWLLEHSTKLSPTLRECVRQSLGLPPTPTPPPAKPQADGRPRSLDPELEGRILRRWHRIMTHRYGAGCECVETGLAVLESVLAASDIPTPDPRRAAPVCV